MIRIRYFPSEGQTNYPARIRLSLNFNNRSSGANEHRVLQHEQMLSVCGATLSPK
jgi:hypothetical protein